MGSSYVFLTILGKVNFCVTIIFFIMDVVIVTVIFIRICIFIVVLIIGIVAVLIIGIVSIIIKMSIMIGTSVFFLSLHRLAWGSAC